MRKLMAVASALTIPRPEIVSAFAQSKHFCGYLGMRRDLRLSRNRRTGGEVAAPRETALRRNPFGSRGAGYRRDPRGFKSQPMIGTSSPCGVIRIARLITGAKMPGHTTVHPNR